MSIKDILPELILFVGQHLPIVTILPVQLWGSSGQKGGGAVSCLNIKLTFVLDQLETAYTPRSVPVLHLSPRSIFPRWCSHPQPNPAGRKEHPPGSATVYQAGHSWAQGLLALSQLPIPTLQQHLSSD